MDNHSEAPPIEVIIKVKDPFQLQLQIDMSKCPSMSFAIAVLSKALRTLKNEESNAASVVFANRLAQEQQDQAVTEAILNSKARRQ